MFLSRIDGLLRCYRTDERGIAAVEFGLIAPIMLLMMLGAVEVGRATVVSRRFDLVTHVIADLVSRDASVTGAGDLPAIASAAQLIWKPYDASTLKFQVLQIRNAGAAAKKIAPNTTYVDWSYSFFGASIPAQCSLYPMPANLIVQGASSIVVNGFYTYTPLFSSNPVFTNVAQMNWTRTVALSPRQTTCVPFTDAPFNEANCGVVTCE